MIIIIVMIIIIIIIMIIIIVVIIIIIIIIMIIIIIITTTIKLCLQDKTSLTIKIFHRNPLIKKSEQKHRKTEQLNLFMKVQPWFFKNQTPLIKHLCYSMSFGNSGYCSHTRTALEDCPWTFVRNSEVFELIFLWSLLSSLSYHHHYHYYFGPQLEGPTFLFCWFIGTRGQEKMKNLKKAFRSLDVTERGRLTFEDSLSRLRLSWTWQPTSEF